GGGKTTLLKTLLGLLAPQAGEVRLANWPLSHYSNRERARLLAYVPQSHFTTFAFSVEAVVLMGRTAHTSLFSRPSAADRALAAQALLHHDFGRRRAPRAARPRASAGAAIRRARRADRKPRFRQPGPCDPRNPGAEGGRSRGSVHDA